jgi:uncharacterized membrane protein
MDGLTNQGPLVLQNLRFTSRQVALISTFIAIGAVVRVGFDQVGDMVPGTAFAVIIKFGLTETLTFVSGFVYGPVAGFVAGFLIILLSDIASPFGAGAWTPFIASIIGLLGICAGIIGRVHSRPTLLMMIVSAIGLTLLSESLQNLYSSVAFSAPLAATMILGLPSLAAALVNNAVLFPTVGKKALEFVQEHHLNEAENKLTIRDR